jgi:zinc transport system substrate-binding protein
MKTLLSAFALMAGLLGAPAGALAAPDVVVSIKPIHSLVASIMKGIAEPEVLLKGAGSPHTYQMTPRDAEALQNADIVFWVGPELEKFLEKPIAALPSGARIVSLEAAPGLTRLPVRESGTFEPHDDGDEPAADGSVEYDAHVWMNTDNAKAMSRAIAAALSEIDPADAPRYADNLAALESRLDSLAAEIRTTVAPVKDKPLVVFHDAYQYFEKEFGINVAGSITVSPEALPGAARIAQIHDKLMSLGASCVFAEPQFEPKLVNVVIEGTKARTGTLDPEAATLTASPDLYFQLMTGIAGSIRSCLSAS